MPVIRKVVTAVVWSFTRCKSFLVQVVLIKGHRSILCPTSAFHQRRGQGARTRGHSSSSLAVQYRLKRSSLIRSCWYSDHFLFCVHHFFLDINFPIINWWARKLVIKIFFCLPLLQEIIAIAFYLLHFQFFLLSSTFFIFHVVFLSVGVFLASFLSVANR